MSVAPVSVHNPDQAILSYPSSRRRARAFGLSITIVPRFRPVVNTLRISSNSHFEPVIVRQRSPGRGGEDSVRRPLPVSVQAFLNPASRVARNNVERVSRGAANAASRRKPAPFDTASTPPFDKLRTEFRPTQDALRLPPERLTLPITEQT